jgi:hypothetical protein
MRLVLWRAKDGEKTRFVGGARPRAPVVAIQRTQRQDSKLAAGACGASTAKTRYHINRRAVLLKRANKTPPLRTCASQTAMGRI